MLIFELAEGTTMNFEEISQEMKEKLKECKTAEDIAELAKSEGIELTGEELEAISGGDWKCSDRICDSFKYCNLY